MFCSKCGKKLADGSKFCTGCGAKLEFYQGSTEKKETSLEQSQEPEVIPQQSAPVFMYENPTPKKKRGGKIALVSCIMVVIALILGIFVWFLIDPIAAHGTIPFLPCPHVWQEASCLVPKTCTICGEIEGEALGHVWQEASCLMPKTCSVCGETEGIARGHSWIPASCLEPATCSICGTTDGEALGHDWIPATTEAPETCSLCGETRGDPAPEPVYLTDLGCDRKFGKYYLHSFDEPTFQNNNDFRDLNTNGFIAFAVDNKGRDYTNGFHLDGPDAGPYYADFALNGKYTELSGVVAVSSSCLGSSSAEGYHKYVEIWCDGILAYKSHNMYIDSSRDSFKIDVSGVDSVRIKYATTDGSNDLATVFDAQLS